MSIIFPSHETMRLAAEAERIQSVAAPRDGSQPGPSFVAPPASQVRAAPIQTPQASSPRLRETQALNAGDCVPPPSIDTAFFAAWRESQGTTIDAEPRVSR